MIPKERSCCPACQEPEGYWIRARSHCELFRRYLDAAEDDLPLLIKDRVLSTGDVYTAFTHLC